jgi:hypothetical protein
MCRFRWTVRPGGSANGQELRASMSNKWQAPRRGSFGPERALLDAGAHSRLMFEERLA